MNVQAYQSYGHIIRDCLTMHNEGGRSESEIPAHAQTSNIYLTLLSLQNCFHFFLEVVLVTSTTARPLKLNPLERYPCNSVVTATHLAVGSASASLPSRHHRCSMCTSILSTEA